MEQPERGAEHTPSDAYSVYVCDDGRVVVYDDRHPNAYLRSDLTVDVVR